MGSEVDGRSPIIGSNMLLAKGSGSGARCETRKTGGRRAAELIMLEERRARRKRSRRTPAMRKRMACRLMLDDELGTDERAMISAGAPAVGPSRPEDLAQHEV